MYFSVNSFGEGGLTLVLALGKKPVELSAFAEPPTMLHKHYNDHLNKLFYYYFDGIIQPVPIWYSPFLISLSQSNI